MTSDENKKDSAKIRDIHEATSKTPWRVQAGTRYCPDIMYVQQVKLLSYSLI